MKRKRTWLRQTYVLFLFPFLTISKTNVQNKDITRGKSVYQAQCIACHHANPKLEGALGPAVAGTSLKLLEARILRAEYPTGYKPKRNTKQMVALPHLKNDIFALHAYLNAAK